MSDGRIIAEAHDYDEIIAALRERSRELGITRKDLEQIADLSEGYPAKVLAGRYSRVLGPGTTALFLGGLGVKLLIVEDAAATERIRRLMNKLGIRPKKPYARQARRLRKDSHIRAFLLDIASKGGKARVKNTTPEQRSASARKAGRKSRRLLTPEQRRQQASNAAQVRWNKEQVNGYGDASEHGTLACAETPT